MFGVLPERHLFELKYQYSGSGKTSMLMALLGTNFSFCLSNWLNMSPQAKCILYRRALTLGITCLVIEVLHTLPRNLGSKMQQFVITSCLELPTRRSGIRKV
jgi:hypothetical protein